MSTHLLATVTAPVVTGFTADGSPDPGATDRLLAHLAAGGIDSLMLFGSNGEGVAVETADVREYVARTAQRWRELVGERATVLVTVTAPTTRMAVGRATQALAGGADALVASAPFYYRYTDTELLHHFQRIDALGAAWVAYNIPRYTGNPLSADLVTRLAELPHCTGIKDSSGDFELLRAFISISGTHPAFGVSQGAESALVTGLQAGANGITPGLANLAPGACRALFDATIAADSVRAMQLQQGLNRLATLHAIRRGIAATKAALALLHLADVAPAEPFRPFDADENQRLATLLDTLAEILSGSGPGRGGRLTR